MLTFLSLVTSVKDYVEIAHKLVETDATLALKTYYDFGGIVTYLVLSLTDSAKEFIGNLVSLKWFQTLWSLPIIIPDISSAMVSEISILDGYFHNAFTFLESPISYGNQNILISSLEKFIIGFLNSIFLFLPSSTAHIITLRRFVMQGLEAGFISGLGTIAGNIFWISSIILGWRFFVIPWLSLDIFRYFLGFVLLVKYMWDSYNEKRSPIITSNDSKANSLFGITLSQVTLKIFLLNFLLALTEQTCFYPYLTNISISPESSILETFPADNITGFVLINLCYIGGLLFGSLSLLHFSCWFWENPAFKMYMWFISNASSNSSAFGATLRASTGSYYKVLNFVFLYLTMICTISSIPYYGLDYILTNPLGLVADDRIINSSTDKSKLLEFSFINTKASDKNTRRNRGRHGRRERWKRRVRKYRTFDASLYDQGVYDLFTIEDLNYGFDRFWLRRKMRNHRVRFRFFPGPWMRSLKKQLAKPRQESSNGPRSEFFRILFEQVYLPSFHSTKKAVITPTKAGNSLQTNSQVLQTDLSPYLNPSHNQSIQNSPITTKSYNSVLRKFVRKFEKRIKANAIAEQNTTIGDNFTDKIYSKRWKQLYARYFSQKSDSLFASNKTLPTKLLLTNGTSPGLSPLNTRLSSKDKPAKLTSELNISKKEKQVYKYKSLFKQADTAALRPAQLQLKSQTLLHPIKFYLQKEQAFERKLRYYSPTLFRTFSVENNAPYLRIMMKKFFYHYKPNLRWKRTMKVASLRKARRKTSRLPKKLSLTDTSLTTNISNNVASQNTTKDKSAELTSITTTTNTQAPIQLTRLQKPTHSYSVVAKRATRYRSKIYRDVIQHWYYTPFNRLLLRFDVDSFIKRQPFSHFLTKKEENLLHLRRFLLGEHYDTLRWYTYMQHYSTMKNKIGGSKSFASKTYNQQFAGTFKKIRHLFAITPNTIAPQSAAQTQTSKTSVATNTAIEKTVLKYDQLLYNEKNSSKHMSGAYLLEEVSKADLSLGLNNNQAWQSKTNTNKGSQPSSLIFSTNNPTIDTIDHSLKEVGALIKDTNSQRQDSIKTLIAQNNSFELAQLLTGVNALESNQTTQKSAIDKQSIDITPSKDKSAELTSNFAQSLNTMLITSYLRKYKKNLGDQEFLKTYLTRQTEKLDKRNNQKEKHLNDRLALMKKLLITPSNNQGTVIGQSQSNTVVTGGLQKAFYSGVSKISSKDKSAKLTSNSISKATVSNIKNKVKYEILSKLNLKANNTKQGLYNKITLQNLKNFANLKQEQQILASIKTLSNVTNTLTAQTGLTKQVSNKVISADLSLVVLRKATNLLNVVKTKSAFIGNKLLNIKAGILKVLNQTNATAIRKQKRLRKVFKKIKNKKYILPEHVRANREPAQPIDVLDSIGVIETVDVTDKIRKFQAMQQLMTQVEVPEIRYPQSKPHTKFVLWRKKRDNKTETSSKDKPAMLTSLWSNDSNANLREANISFKRKRSQGRRAIANFKRTRTRGVIYKRKLTSGFKHLKDTRSLSDSDFVLATDKSIKNKRSTIKKHRFWRSHKRNKYSQKYRKYRKTTQDVVGKIRLLSKQKQKIYQKKALQTWWTQNFLPNLQANTNVLWQIEKEKQILSKLNELYGTPATQTEEHKFKPLLYSKDKSAELTSRPLKSSVTKVIKDQSAELTLLALQKLSPANTAVTTRVNPTNTLPFYAGWDESLRKFVITNRLLSRREAGFTFNENPLNPTTKDQSAELTLERKHFQKAPLQGMNAPTTLYWQLPFTTYDPDQFFALGMDGFSPIGWRRFQFRHTILKNWITSINKPAKLTSKDKPAKLTSKDKPAKLTSKDKPAKLTSKDKPAKLTSKDKPAKLTSFNKTSKEPNPFTQNNKNLNNLFVIEKSLLKLSGKAQKISKEVSSADLSLEAKSFTQLAPSIVSWNSSNVNTNATVGNNINSIMRTFERSKVSSAYLSLDAQPFSSVNDNFKNKKNLYRRLKKRYRKVKKHPRPPVWFASGPLLNQVLPVHYIYIFYKRYRLPKERYLKRRLLKGKTLGDSSSTKDKSAELTSFAKKQAQTKVNNNTKDKPAILTYTHLDFTLRRRVKPKRKYHRKPLALTKGVGVGYITESQKVEPRRYKFLKEKSDMFMLERPYSTTKKYKDNLPKAKKTKKTNKVSSADLSSVGDSSNMLRVRQLRRRMQRQIVRPVWRYKPRAGGFVWPGDYLKLELVKAPLLNTKQATAPTQSKLVSQKTSKKANKLKRKKKRVIQEWQPQPKKYLLEKHNVKVLKKKLEKANRSIKIREHIKQTTLRY
uniref:hypothetical chloroplast RF1 n=1 Tax=Leontynka pallida TaxID=2912034 RepID=UPI0020287A90|nr:hypothetical chloroplast RF1 [Leontynka pallida]UPQ43854.1 hypothetical chloroplast RF1 [Leontynka pallida]